MNGIDRRDFLVQGSTSFGALWAANHADRLYRPPAPLALGVIGCGRQGREILAELARFENVEVVAVAETNKRRLRRGLRRTRGAQGIQDHRELLGNPKVDAVFLAVETHRHRALAIESLNAGKHVYCEAPLASSMEDLRAIVRAAEKASAVFQVGHLARSNPVYALARGFYRSNSIETLVALQAAYHQKTSWRTRAKDAKQDRIINWRLFHETSSGLLGEMGSHQIDAISWFTKKRPVEVDAKGAIHLYDDGREVADTVRATFAYENGVELNYDATLCNSFQGSFESFYGSMGTIKMAQRFGWLFKEADAPIQGWEVYASRQQFHDEQGITLIAEATKLASQGKLKEGIGLPHPPLHYALEAFLKSVGEKSKVVCDARHGLEAAAIAIRANEALKKGQSLSIDETLFKV